MIIATIAFYTFASLLLVSALMVITVKNPVHSVMFLIFAFFNSAALFILLGAEFIAMLMVIVYVGAVAILFLFVVMMLNIDATKLRASFIRYLPLGVLMLLAMLAEMVMVIRASTDAKAWEWINAKDLAENNTQSIGQVLYTDYLYAFELSGLILLVAMASAIVLTLRQRPGVRKQKIGEQVARKPEDCIEVVNIKSRSGV